MKQYQVCFLFFLLFQYTDIMSIEKDKKQKSLYTYYIILKETCRAYAYSFFLDEVKLEKAKIACCQCHKTYTSGYLWGYCAGACNEVIIEKLILLMYSSSVEELVSFLVVTYTELSIPCSNCRQYHGWYIIETY